MLKIVVFTDKEAEDLCYDRQVEYMDTSGVKTIFMNETRYNRFITEEYLKDDEDEY